MSVQKYIISKKTTGFTVIPNTVLQCLKNYEALGLYCYLVSLPPGWEFYKIHLQEHAKIGRDKLDRLLKILSLHNLIKIEQVRKENGQFSHFDLHVDDGSSFKINEMEKQASPFPEKPLTVNQGLVNSTYKRNIINKTNKINKSSLVHETKVLSTKSVDNFKKETKESIVENKMSRFEEFYAAFPKKKDRPNAERAWKKHNCNEIADFIIQDVQKRIRQESQWANPQFIPHPSTYLNNKRWEDDITENHHGKGIGYPKSLSSQDKLQRGWDVIRNWN
jgi:hypothetical protein